MKTETIEVEGLPEGWKAVEIRVDPDQYNKYVGDDGCLYWEAKVKMEKIQPRRIAFDEITDGTQNLDEDYYHKSTWWREVKENDIPLTSEEPKLSLSVEECRNVRSLIKDFENLGWFVSPASSLLLQKITEFTKENS